jgi:hypothetical protein
MHHYTLALSAVSSHPHYYPEACRVTKLGIIDRTVKEGLHFLFREGFSLHISPLEEFL